LNNIYIIFGGHPLDEGRQTILWMKAGRLYAIRSSGDAILTQFSATTSGSAKDPIYRPGLLSKVILTNTG
jgi:hypothetical protein